MINHQKGVSGLFTADLKAKPAYLALERLINHEWKTRTTAVAAAGDGDFATLMDIISDDGRGNARVPRPSW